MRSAAPTPFRRPPGTLFLGLGIFAVGAVSSLIFSLRLSSESKQGLMISLAMLIAVLVLGAVFRHYRLALAIYFFSLTAQHLTLFLYFTPIKLAFLLLMFGFTVRLAQGRRKLRWVPRLHIPQIAFLLIAVLSTVLHYRPGMLAVGDILRFASGMVLLLLLPSLFSTKRDFITACWSATGVLVVMEVYAGVQTMRGMGRIPATFAHGADFAVFLSFVIPLCLCTMVVLVSNFPIRAALAGIAFAGFVCVLLTGTRSGYIGCLAMILMAAWLFPKLRIPVVLMGASAVVIFLAMWPHLTDLREEIGRKFHFESGKGQMGIDISTSTRLLTFDASKRVIRENPLLGIGIGNFTREMLAYIPKEYRGYFVYTVVERKKGRATHNAFLDVWTETGTIGLIAFLVLVGNGVWNLIGLGFRGPSDLRPLAKFLLVGYVGTFLTGFLHGGFVTTQYCWLHLGLGFGLAGIALRPDNVQDPVISTGSTAS